MRTSRRGDDPISVALCKKCQEVAEGLQGENVVRQLLWPIVTPAAYQNTHEICPACLDLKLIRHRHDPKCALNLAHLQLSAGGWATCYSKALRKDLRAKKPLWAGIAINILTCVIRPHVTPFARIVPIPISGQRNGLLEATEEVGRRLSVTVIPAVTRNKKLSTRMSVAQTRALIADSEYSLVPGGGSALKDTRVILVDDNVTTGSTLSRVGGMLLNSGVGEVVPVAIDRTISPRLEQRLSELNKLGCSHILVGAAPRDQ